MVSHGYRAPKRGVVSDASVLIWPWTGQRVGVGRGRGGRGRGGFGWVGIGEWVGFGKIARERASQKLHKSESKSRHCFVNA